MYPIQETQAPMLIHRIGMVSYFVLPTTQRTLDGGWWAQDDSMARKGYRKVEDMMCRAKLLMEV